MWHLTVSLQYMPMTVKYMVPANLMPHLLCRPTSQNVLMTCTAGCGRTGCNLMVRRQRWCGVHLPAGCCNFPTLRSASLAQMFIRSVQFETSGVYINSDLGAATHVRKTVSCCFATLRQLRHLRRYVTDDCFHSLVVSLIHSRLDYGNFVLVGLPAYLQQQLQSVLNAAARLVFRLRRYDHITDALAILNWLCVPQRVDFKIAVMAFRVLHGLAPPYLNQLVRVADLPGRRTRSLHSSSHQLDIPAYRLESIGRRSFPVTASTLWNTLPSEIQSSPSLTVSSTTEDVSISGIIPWCPTLMTTSPWTSQ